jgi:hypothetical protein
MPHPDELAAQIDNLRTLAQIIATLLIVVAVESHRIRSERAFVPILLALSAVALVIDTFVLVNVDPYEHDPTYIGACLTMSGFIVAVMAISIPLLLIKASKPDPAPAADEP